MCVWSAPGIARCRGQQEAAHAQRRGGSLTWGGKRKWTWGETEMALPAQGTGVPSHASLANGAVRGWER